MAKGPKRIYNCLPSQNTAEDWNFEDAKNAGALAAAPPPQNKDLRENWWKINDQGTTGSCVGWAIGDSLIRWHFVQSDQLEADELLSVRYLWMAAKEIDEFVQRPTSFIEKDGTSLKAALDVARKFGLVLDKLLPFGSGKLYGGTAEAFYLIAAQRRIPAYVNLGIDLARWRDWIATNGPIAVRLDVDEAFEAATAANSQLTIYQKPNTPQGHAVTLVGYTPDHFIVRNSWGTAWGEQGFAFATNAYASLAFTEAYGIVSG